MAGITSASSSLFQPTLTPSKTTPSPLPRKSNLFGLRLHDRYLSQLLPAYSMPKTVVTARYGGPMDSRRSRQGYSEEDQALDVSGMRSAAVRLIDENQNMVKVIVNLKGRENDFRNIAIELIRRFQNDIGELATEENKNFSDRNIFITLVPNKAVLQKAQEPPKKKENSVINEVSAGV